MKYKVGDQVIVEVEHQKDGHKRIVIKEPLITSKVIEKSFHIASKNEAEETYTLIVDDDMVGWIVGSFRIKHGKIDKKYLNKKFYDVQEEDIISKKL